jgi:hypothetical protein
MDMRYDMRDMRNPYGSRGGYVVSSRGGRRGRRRGDRGQDYGNYDMRHSNMPQDYRGNDYNYDVRGGRDYGNDMARGRYDHNMDGHHYPQGQGSTYYPIQAMGTFEGYYGMPEQDYARGGRGYGYDMRGHRDYGMSDYRGRDYGDYDDYGDYGETLSEEELEKWAHKLKGQLDEREKQMFSKEAIANKARTMGKQMEGFGEKELEVATLMVYTDYKNTIGQNLDIAVKLAYDWLADKDVAVKGAEKLAVYYDCIVEGQ